MTTFAGPFLFPSPVSKPGPASISTSSSLSGRGVAPPGVPTPLPRAAANGAISTNTSGHASQQMIMILIMFRIVLFRLLLVTDQPSQLLTFINDLRQLLAPLKPRLRVFLSLAFQLFNLGLELFNIDVLFVTRLESRVPGDFIREHIVRLADRQRLLCLVQLDAELGRVLSYLGGRDFDLEPFCRVTFPLSFIGRSQQLDTCNAALERGKV
ncbi:hypothetical protein KCU88_g186, partial [Aureobasidium melanogenum]